MQALQQRRQIERGLEPGKTETEAGGADLDPRQLLRRRLRQSPDILRDDGQIQTGAEAHDKIAEVPVIAGRRGDGIGRAAPAGASRGPVEVLTRDHDSAAARPSKIEQIATMLSNKPTRSDSIAVPRGCERWRARRRIKPSVRQGPGPVSRPAPGARAWPISSGGRASSRLPIRPTCSESPP